jgi:hypothetical protein
MTDQTADSAGDHSASAADAGTPDVSSPAPPLRALPRPLLASITGRIVRTWRALQLYEAGRFTAFVALACIGLLYSLALISGNNAPTTYLFGDVNLYTSANTAGSAVLDIKFDPFGLSSLISIRPAFNVPSGKTVHWAVLADQELVTGPLPENDSKFFDPQAGEQPPTVRSVVDRSGTKYWLFTGVVTGPADELPAERSAQLTDWALSSTTQVSLRVRSRWSPRAWRPPVRACP